MNKKLLLSTTIAGSMLIAGMANPSFAASDVRYNSNWVEANNPSIAIELDVGDKDLSRSDLVSIIEQRYSAGSVLSISYNNSAISDPDALVPTGAKVSLSNR